MKRKLIFLVAGLLFMVSAVQQVNGQTEISDAASTSATIITPIAISKTVDLNFGNIVAGTAGTVTVGTDDSRSSTGGVTLPTATPGTITAAQFDVTGLANATYSITVPASFNVTGPGDDMEVSTFVTDPTPTGTLDGSGEQTISVGATLAVGANQTAGTYTNADALVITVAYN